MAGLPTSLRNRFYGNAALPTDRAQRPRAQYTARTDADGGVATLRISEPIDSWGWPWGVSAADVQAVLDELPDDVREIRVEINSPGGEATEGMAITNVLRNHPATVTSVVFGMAASAASVIAVSADETVMNPGSWLMIHNAWGIEIGEAKDMRSYADYLDKLSDNYADTYAAAAGGTREDWRAAMDAETWYLPDEAVAAGLADRVGKATDGDASTGDPAAARARFDLSMFAHAGRDQAPAPALPARTQTPSTEPVQGYPTRKGDADMAFTDDVRQRLGITDEAATDETLLAALDEALAEQADDTSGAASAQLPEGVTAIETETLNQLRASAQRGEDARAQQEREGRERIVDQAIADGKFGRARRDHWLASLTADPEGAAATIAGLERGLVPVEPIGHDTGDTAPANSLADVRESDAYKGWTL